jgi:hypothetical protein
MTANALGQGKNQVVIFRQTTEQLLNDCLQQYAPQKTIMLNGLALTVENRFLVYRIGITTHSLVPI